MCMYDTFIDNKHFIIAIPYCCDKVLLKMGVQVSGSQFSIIRGTQSGNPLQYSCLENPMDGGAW